MLPLEHLSASSFSLFMRCPRQWQNKYLRKIQEPKGSALVVGSAVHAALADLFTPKGFSRTLPVRDFFEESKEEGVIWKESEAKAREAYEFHVTTYWERVGQHLDVQRAEQEVLFEVPGVDLPILGYIDAETEDRIIDFKTTGYRSRAVQVNHEWLFQVRVYQLAVPKAGEIHVLTRSAKDPVIVPRTFDDELYIPLGDTEKTIKTLADHYRMMVWMYEEFGLEEDFPGNTTHQWAGKYCAHPNCCVFRR